MKHRLDNKTQHTKRTAFNTSAFNQVLKTNPNNQIKNSMDNLRDSIQNLELLISKSQQLLKVSRKNQQNKLSKRHRSKVKSDSLDIHFNESGIYSPQTQKNKKIRDQFTKSTVSIQIDHNNTTNDHEKAITKKKRIFLHNFNNKQDLEKKNVKIINIVPQYLPYSNESKDQNLKKPKKPIFIDLNSSQQCSQIHEKSKQNILICDQLLSPINKGQYQQTIYTTLSGLENQSFEGLSNNNKFQQKSFDNIPQKKREIKLKNHQLWERQSKRQHQLKKKLNYYSDQPKLQFKETLRTIQQMSKKSTKYHNKYQNSKEQSIKRLLTKKTTQCEKYQKDVVLETKNSFVNKMRRYGFVQRYLTEGQIISIYQGLKNSDIPQHRWPLVVIDEVYAKMKIIKA